MAKRTHTLDDEPVELHDSGFSPPMVMFPTFPYNDTFLESRKMKLVAGPTNCLCLWLTASCFG
jgi:hypothetical protein